MKETIAIIEDDKIMRVTLEDALKSKGYDVFSFETGEEALKAIKGNHFSVIVTDVRLPDIDGTNILREISSQGDSQVIVMTAFGTIRDAVEVMKLGAFDYITKPFSLDEFLLLIERALDVKRLREENIRLKHDLNKCYSFPNIIGHSP
ncbi:MAG: sigma-54-dependent transcriptional regulator, partial [Thermodesulfovibrionales bacterium]